ncbi:WD40-repeat-containing domain protein [Fimicolochytrium jonesii]|uniref:WD40-repeat-containing domain protein n=1 Tax=Fimicolochytrium jonesii TaxID=1396493 RepID=UPI0022FF4224|nr:WD40-repeat-containing domain protein [Fimicolochytrium jonesii]KAI8819473.1 WD40-repeat-containing domain protein [Fimicolochytrium jonesii]
MSLKTQSHLFGSTSSLGAASSLLPTALSREMSRDRLAGEAAKLKKPKLSSLSNLVSQRDSSATGQLAPRPGIPLKASSEVYSVKFSLNDEYIASGLGDSKILIISTQTGEPLNLLTPTTLDTYLPCTSLAFRPDSNAYKNKNVLAAAYASGHIIHWHTTSNQIISTIDEGDHQTQCVVYNNAGTKFATGGSDCNVRVYDGVQMKEVVKMNTGTGGAIPETAGHSNRIFTVKFHPTSPHILYSGGWDNTIQIWDTRSQKSIRSIYGPHICGDALDLLPNSDLLLTGSYRKDSPLQLWSFDEGRVVETLAWTLPETPGEAVPGSFLYSASFSKSGKYVLAAGGMMNQVKLFSLALKRPVGMVVNLPATVYSAAISYKEKTVAFGGADGGLWIYDVDTNGLTDFVY